MTLAVGFLGTLMAGLGLAGVLSPKRLLDLVARAQSQLGLYVIAGFRLLVGMALLYSAGSSRAPLYLQIIGGVSLFSGVITPFFGVQRFEAVLSWFRRLPPWLVRLWSVVVIVFGLSLVWAVLPLERAA